MDLETSAYEKLINQCKSNDVDVKVDALTKLQSHFSKAIVEVPDSDTLITILKTSLRSSNLHLTNATLSALPAILPSLITRSSNASQFSSNANLASSSTSSVTSNAFDVATLRQAIIAFLSTGGIVDRLGDKEKAQTKARETLVLLGGYAFRAGGGSTITNKSGKGQETPLAIFERIIKENGLGSKVWKVREQSILALVNIRRSHHLFPIRPYLSLLVDCLEDTDPHVRDCARQSIVELFTGPGVTDAARADLKKELMKKGVRKTIVDDVLAKLLHKASTSSTPSNYEGSENGDPPPKREYLPPSLALKRSVSGPAGPVVPRTVSQSSIKDMLRPASRAAAATPPPSMPAGSETTEVISVYIASSRDLETEFADMQKYFEGRESEHNWLPRDQAIQRVRGMLKGGVHERFAEPFLGSLKDFIQCSLKTLASLRTTVAMNTCLLYTELASTLGHLLDPHCEVLVTNLLKMAGLTKKITAQQSQSCITTIVTHTSPQPRLYIPAFWTTLQEKIVQARAYAVGHFKHYLETHGTRSKSAIENSGNLEILEKAVKKALADPNPSVRETARSLFWVFEGVWSGHGGMILESLDATARKQLEKACPNPHAQTALPPKTPQPTKKSSVAAAIAASRAKAKAIATAPPSLRHQATSHSGTGPRRISSPTTSPKSTTAVRPSSPLRMSTSPSPSRSRILPGTLPRSTSSNAILTNTTTTHTRVPSGGSDTANRSTSPALSDSARRRLSSSPLTNAATGSTIRKALSTALPASPPSSVGHITPPRKRNGAVAVPAPARPSLAQLPIHYDDSLLMAQAVPIPEDSDSEDDNAINVMSFSEAFERITPRRTPKSPPLTQSPSSDSRPTAAASVSNALSTGSIGGPSSQPIVEDALRARAEQAESAAERLLELVEPEDDASHHPLPPALMKSTSGRGAAPLKVKLKPVPIPGLKTKVVPRTPNNRASAILKQAALFADSPAQKNGGSTSLLDVLRDEPQETGWWLKRKALTSQPAKFPPIASDPHQELEMHIAALEKGDIDVPSLKRLALFCSQNSVTELLSPLSGHFPPSPTFQGDGTMNKASNSQQFWEEGRNFERLFKSLVSYIQPDKSEDELAYGLIVVWEILENQVSFLDGKESDIFAVILRVRYSNKVTVLEGTNAIRDILASKLDAVYGLTTLHASLRSFHNEPAPSADDEEVKASTYSFGLMALGKFILRLPAEIAEEELPRLKQTLVTALNDKSSLIIRESAAASIIAAQLVLRDETHLFTLLDGLADEKKNLLTYLFDKHGARNTAAVNGATGMDKIEKEMRRLDTRTSTPLRGGL